MSYVCFRAEKVGWMHSPEAIYLPGWQNWERIPMQLSGASVSNSLHVRAEREGRAVNFPLLKLDLNQYCIYDLHTIQLKLISSLKNSHSDT